MTLGFFEALVKIRHIKTNWGDLADRPFDML
jgi:hypothetical protein